MIVVVGLAALRTTPAGSGEAVGAAPAIAAAAAADGAAVEIVTKIGEDGAGEELLLALGRAGVGHLAALRDPTRPTALAMADGEAPEYDLDLVSILLADGDGATGDRLDAPPSGSPPRSTSRRRAPPLPSTMPLSRISPNTASVTSTKAAEARSLIRSAGSIGIIIPARRTVRKPDTGRDCRWLPKA